MIVVNIVWSVVIAAGLLSCLLMAAVAWFRFPDRTADDVVDFLLHVDLEEAEALLDPGVEFSLRQALSAWEFRRLQRKRVYLYMEFLRKMAKNSTVLVEFANHEAQRGGERTAPLVRTLQQEGIAVRLYSLLTLMKLRFWLLVRLDSWWILPALSLSGARETFGIRGLESYHRLKTATTALFLQLHPQQFREIGENL